MSDFRVNCLRGGQLAGCLVPGAYFSSTKVHDDHLGLWLVINSRRGTICGFSGKPTRVINV